jgi:hypothetical protein
MRKTFPGDPVPRAGRQISSTAANAIGQLDFQPGPTWPESTKPQVDHCLCLRAEIYSTGEHVHTAANLLAVYLAELEAPDFSTERFRTAETRLRAFVSHLLLAKPELVQSQ